MTGSSRSTITVQRQVDFSRQRNTCPRVCWGGRGKGSCCRRLTEGRGGRGLDGAHPGRSPEPPRAMRSQGTRDMGREGRLCDKRGTFDIMRGIMDSVQWCLLSTCCGQAAVMGGAHRKIRTWSSLALLVSSGCITNITDGKQQRFISLVPEAASLGSRRGWGWCLLRPLSLPCRRRPPPPRPRVLTRWSFSVSASHSLSLEGPHQTGSGPSRRASFYLITPLKARL